MAVRCQPSRGIVDGGRLERRYQLAIRFQPAYGIWLNHYSLTIIVQEVTAFFGSMALYRKRTKKGDSLPFGVFLRPACLLQRISNSSRCSGDG